MALSHFLFIASQAKLMPAFTSYLPATTQMANFMQLLIQYG